MAGTQLPPGLSQVQSVGDFQAVLNHPLVLGGISIPLVGFKLEGEIVRAEQLIDSAKMVVLIGGLAITLTNTVGAGTLRWAVVPTTWDVAKGDIVAVSHLLKQIGDNIGGVLRVSWGQNGVTHYKNFLGVTCKRCDDLALAGNDIPDYRAEWFYNSFTEG
jgi:hypothetical protein